MNRKTLIALVVFVVLLGIVYFLQTRPEKGERVGERPRPLAKMELKKLDKITIIAKGKTVVLQRVAEAKAKAGDKDKKKEADKEEDKGRWELVKPVRYKADKYASDSVLEKLEGLEFGDLVSEQKAKHAEYEVDDKAGIRVQVSAGKQMVADFYLGKVMNQFTMFRLKGKDAVYQAVGSLRMVFEREMKNWRDRTIFDFKQEQARKLELTGKDGAIVFSREAHDKPWKVEASPVKIDQLDTAAVDSLLTGLYSLSAFDFADNITQEKAGLDKPSAFIQVNMDKGKYLKLLVGQRKDDTWWVRREDAMQVFTLQKNTMESLLQRPIDFRDKTVLSFKAEDVVALTINQLYKKNSVKLIPKGDGWLGDGKKVADTAKIKGALDALSALKAAGFAKHSIQELGLDKPNWTVVIQLKDRTQHLLTVGSVEQDGTLGVIRKGVDDVFSFRKYTLERFLLDPKDYK